MDLLLNLLTEFLCSFLSYIRFRLFISVLAQRNIWNASTNSAAPPSCVGVYDALVHV